MDYYDDEPPEIDPDMEEEAIAYDEDDIPDDIVQEMMGAEADLAEYSLKSVSAFHNDQSINNYPLSPGASASFNQLSKPPVTGKYASPSGPSPGFDFNYIVKKAPKSDLLQDLIAAREQSLAKVPSMNSLLQRGSGSGEELLVTQREGIVLKVTISERDDCLLSMLPPTDEGESSELSGPTKYMSCTLEDESRMYIKRRSAVEGYSSGGGGGGSDGGNLLGTSIEALLEESHAKQVNARLQLEHAERGDAEGRGLDYATSIASVAATGQEAGAGAGTDSLASSLWVEKYAPKAFSQLLSLERTNRDVLKALKAWDAYVFNKPVPKSKGKNDLYAAGPAGSGGSSKYKSGGGDDDGDSDSDNEADSDPADLGSQSKSVDLRPQQRVILLSGPPGSGKTTLAHVIARHCGYNVIEVNASDDRSSAVLKDKIQRSIQSNTISLAPTAAGGASIGGVAAGATKPSPNCLILDEIDGIDSRETVDMLCKIIKAPLPNQKDQGSKDTALTRPLICVCNDQYAPALRELRKHCQIFTFTTPLVGRLVQRLKRILSLEGVDLPPSVLSMLCAANGNDIRSCLNTLQFATLQCKEAVDLDHLAGAGGRKLQGMQLVSHTLNQMVLHGLKDEQKSAFQIWKVLFNNRDAAALLGGGSAHSASSGSAAPAVPTAPARVVRDKAAADGQLGRMLMSIVDEFDDMELLVGGLHENLLAINYNDPCLTKTSSAFDWLSYADIMAPGYGGHSPFTSAACVAIHMMCAVDHRTQVSWPQKDREMHFKKQEVQSMLQSLVDNRFAGPGGARAEPKREGSDFDCDSDSDSCSGSTHTSVYASRQAIAVDTISFLVSLVHPKVRAHISSVSSLSMVERHILHETAQILVACGLSFIENSSSQTANRFGGPERGGDDALKLEPNITQLIKPFCRQPEGSETGLRGQTSVREVATATAPGAHPMLVSEQRVVPAMSADVRNALHVESRKLFLKLQMESQRARDGDAHSRQAVRVSPPQPAPTNVPVAPPVVAPVVPTVVPAVATILQPVASGKVDSFFKSKKRSASTIATNPTGTASAPGTAPTATSKKKKGIHFKFLLGATNAVKRAVNISEFCA